MIAQRINHSRIRSNLSSSVMIPPFVFEHLFQILSKPETWHSRNQRFKERPQINGFPKVRKSRSFVRHQRTLRPERLVVCPCRASSCDFAFIVTRSYRHIRSYQIASFGATGGPSVITRAEWARALAKSILIVITGRSFARLSRPIATEPLLATSQTLSG